ncbi:hypothetical protein ACFE04_000692 [Oxalis oulophora]
MAKRKTKQTRRRTSPSSSPISPPLPFESEKSPKSSILNRTNDRSKTSTKKKITIDSLSPNVKVSSIADLKNLASSRLDDLKRNLIDRSHSEILKDLEASLSRLHKRIKIQTQASQKLMDDAEKDYTNVSKRITENQEAMKASYAEFMADAQATSSRMLKTSIPEVSKSLEKAVDALHSRYGVRSG